MNGLQQRFVSECVWCGLIARTLTEPTALAAAFEHEQRKPGHPVLTDLQEQPR